MAEKKRFTSLEEREAAIASLRTLLASPGWRDVLVLNLQDTVTILQHQLESGEFQTLEEMQRAQDKLRIARNLLTLPEDLIKFLQSGEQPPVIFDVYA